MPNKPSTSKSESSFTLQEVISNDGSQGLMNSNASVQGSINTHTSQSGSHTLGISDRQSSNQQSNFIIPASRLSSVPTIVRGLQQDIGKIQQDIGKIKQDISKIYNLMKKFLKVQEKKN